MIPFQYYSSCTLPQIWQNRPLIPAAKILSLSGFDIDKIQYRPGFENAFFTGDCCMFYVLLKQIPYMENRLVCAWKCTKSILFGQSFNEEVDFLLTYKSLHEYHGVAFVLTLGCIEENIKHDRPVAFSFLTLYNSKRLFRRGLYELQMHYVDGTEVKSLEDILQIPDLQPFYGKPKEFQQLNFLLKMNRRAQRGELPQSSLNRSAQIAVQKAILDSMQEASALFLSIEFKFTRHLFCTIPIIHRREVINVSTYRSEKLNPVDEKFVKLFRNPKMGDIDRGRRPNDDELKHLKILLAQPLNYILTANEIELIWKFRFYLSKQFPEESLAKVILSAKWEYSEQQNQIVELLNKWPYVAPECVMELLTKRFKDMPCVRRFAVSRLQNASDEFLSLYLYQLVQALRYEDVKVTLDNFVLDKLNQHKEDDVTLIKQISDTETEPDMISLTNDFKRFSTRDNDSLPADDQSLPSSDMGTQDEAFDSLQQHPSLLSAAQAPPSLPHAPAAPASTEAMELASFLIDRVSQNHQLANYFHWYLYLEKSANQVASEMYDGLFKVFMERLKKIDTMALVYDLKNQRSFLRSLSEIMSSLGSYSRQKKIELLRRKLRDGDFPNVNNIHDPFCFPLNPLFRVARIDPDTAYLFKSGKEPALLTLISTDDRQMKVIFKNGDDLRQDQLALQMIQLMDTILRKDNCDLQLTPYKVLATSDQTGFVEFIESVSIYEVLAKHRTILAYLQEIAPGKTPLGVNKEVMTNYIRSCAGYCVVTYLLGVGDRHYENIMITKQGQFFHIDFGFILGYDPKPMPPEIRLTQPMIEAMGGANSDEFKEFYSLTFQVYSTLRRHANLFLTMFSLALDAGIKDISRDPNKVFDFFKERFCLGQSEDVARYHLAKKITDSTNAFMPELMEKLHAMMQLWRN